MKPETSNKGAPMMIRGVLNAKVMSMPDRSTDPPIQVKCNEDEFEPVEVEELVPLYSKQTRRVEEFEEVEVEALEPSAQHATLHPPGK